MRRILGILLLVPTLLHAESLIIGIDEGNGPEIVESSTRLVTRLSKETGFTLEAKPYPSLRLKELLAKGRIDGSLPNSEKVFEDYAGQIRKVPHAVMRTRVYAYSAKPLVFSGLKDLKNLKFLKVTGLNATNHLLDAEKIPAAEIQGVDKVLNMIAANRADVALVPDVFARRYLQNNRLANIVENHPLIAHIDAYLWLGIKHQNLIPAFDKAIADLDRTGELDDFFATKMRSENHP